MRDVSLQFQAPASKGITVTDFDAAGLTSRCRTLPVSGGLEDQPQPYG
jgi:hypothetical protein